MYIFIHVTRMSERVSTQRSSTAADKAVYSGSIVASSIIVELTFGSFI